MTDPTTSADYAALLRGVLEEPAANLPRLVAADWLEDTGDEAGVARAAMIRYYVREHPGAIAYSAGRSALQHVPGEPRGGFATSRQVVVAPATPGVAWTISRGFVSAVTLTQAQFVGGECGACQYGSGRARSSAVADSPWVVCPACSGTGRTPGLAAALFRAHPITAVTLSNVIPHAVTHPMQYASDGPYLFFGESHPDAEYRRGAVLPDGLLARVRTPATDDDHEASFWSVFQAVAALSGRCVAYGRQLAGLPPLPAPADAVPA